MSSPPPSATATSRAEISSPVPTCIVSTAAYDGVGTVVGKCECQGRADGPGSDDDEIAKHETRLQIGLRIQKPTAESRGDAKRRPLQRGHHRAHAASTSLIVLGVAAVRFSL